jgi:DNA topoisomerase-1
MSHSHSAFVRDLAKAKGLTLVAPAALTVRRIARGTGFSYCRENGRRIRDKAELARLKALAVPPAYVEVRFAADPAAHLQAVGTDAAGRLQYRYHPAWTEVREAVKARRLARLARALPEIKRAVVRTLAAADLSADFAAAAVVRLVDLTALRAGAERHARDRGTRGASTLLKSNVVVRGNIVLLEFKAKGAKKVTKEVSDARLAKAITRLQQLPGRRLFQYRAADGTVHSVRAREVNDYLRKVGGRRISLKDFRTLVGSTGVLEALAAQPAGLSQRERRSQLRSAVIEVAEELANTPTVCRKSYVHAAVVTAFESGRLSRMRKAPTSPVKKAAALARLVTET